MFKQNIKEDSKSREWAMDTSVPRSYSGEITGYGGHASGDYAMDLDDGSWYVFLQYSSALSPDQYGGRWNDAVWGPSESDTNPLTKDGCAIYSMAMTVSNSVGRLVTPEEILLAAGITIERKGSQIWYNTGTSGCFFGRDVNRQAFVSTICSAYGLEYVSVNNQTDANAIIQKGGYIWGRYSPENFQWYYGSDGHFMAIRSSAYRVLTSSDLVHNTLNLVTDFETWWGHRDGDMFGIWNPNPAAGYSWGAMADRKYSLDLRKIFGKLSP